MLLQSQSQGPYGKLTCTYLTTAPHNIMYAIKPQPCTQNGPASRHKPSDHNHKNKLMYFSLVSYNNICLICFSSCDAVWANQARNCLRFKVSATLTLHVDGWRKRNGGRLRGVFILAHQPNSQTVAKMVSEVALFRGTSGQMKSTIIRSSLTLKQGELSIMLVTCLLQLTLNF